MHPWSTLQDDFNGNPGSYTEQTPVAKQTESSFQAWKSFEIWALPGLESVWHLAFWHLEFRPG
jgi:hypothetical protein